MSWSYPLAPLLGYVVAGCLKFAINSVRARGAAFAQIGLGGMPSTHTTIVTSIAVLVGLRNGFDTPLFGVALALGLIVVIDAMDLRRRIGRQASILKAEFAQNPEAQALRERMGHSPLEVLGGIVVGGAVGFLLSLPPW